MATGQISLVLGHLRRLIGPRAAPDQTDVQLLHRFLHLHEDAAFENLVQRHGPLVLGLCRRVLQDAHDAEDAFQATFLVLARKAGSIRKQQSLGSWLYGVAYRVARKARASVTRRRAWEKPAGALLPGELPASAAGPAATVAGLADPSAGQLDPAVQAMSQEIRAVVDEELQRLPYAYRESLVRCYLQGQTNEEAARALGWPAGSMSRHLARARDLLRERLVRRGLGTSAGLFGTVLTDQLAAAPLPAALITATSRAALAFAARGAGLVGVISPQAAGFAQSIVRAMFMTKLKIATVLLLTAGVLALGVGRFWYPAAAAAPPAADGAKQPAKKDAARPDADKRAKGSTSPVNARAAALRKKLNELVTMEKGIDPSTPFADALDFISDHFDLPIVLDSQAFKDEATAGKDDEIQSVGSAPVGLKKMTNVPLGSVLRLVLAQVPPHGATYLVRPEGLLVTTPRRSRPEDWTGSNRRGVPAVNVVLDQIPLAKALQDLADQTGINVVVDGRVADKVQTPVTATLNNVPLDTAVRLLADMADLKAVAIDNVLYVTNPANARALQAEQEKRHEKPPPRKQPQVEPAKGPAKEGRPANPKKKTP